MTAKAMCQRPARSRVMRYDFACGYGAGQTEPHPADLRHEDLGPLPVQLHDPRCLAADDAEPFVPPGFAPGRAPVGAGVEVLTAWSKSRSACCCTVCDPAAARDRCSRLGQLAALFREARRRPTPARPHGPLLQRQIPHEPSVRAVARAARPPAQARASSGTGTRSATYRGAPTQLATHERLCRRSEGRGFRPRFQVSTDRPATYSYKELAARIEQVLGECPSLSALSCSGSSGAADQYNSVPSAADCGDAGSAAADVEDRARGVLGRGGRSLVTGPSAAGLEPGDERDP